MKRWTAEELKAKESDFDFGDELSEYLDCVRICDICHHPMIDGYCIDDGMAHYCSDECLHCLYSDEEFQAMYDDREGISYWGVWWK